MPKYMLEASYTVEGVQGLFRDGGTGRRTAIENTVKGLGGSVESVYYVFGDDDILIIADMPDNISVAAFSLSVAATGAASASVRVLLTPEDIDAAVRKQVSYRAPGT